MWTEYHKISDANYIGWINLIQINTTHHAKLGLMRTRKVTLILLQLKWLPQASLGAFSFTVWKNWGWGIHESTPQPRGKNTVKRNSKRENSRKSSKNQRLFPGANLVVRPALDRFAKIITSIFSKFWKWEFENFEKSHVFRIFISRTSVSFFNIKTYSKESSGIEPCSLKSRCTQYIIRRCSHYLWKSQSLLKFVNFSC